MNIRVGEFSGSDATNALHATIKEFNEQTKKQTDQIVTLTKVIVWLTLAMLLGVGVQIFLAYQALH